MFTIDSITFKCLDHLEQHVVESVWSEVKLKRASPQLLGFVYRNPAKRADWTDHFVSMMDAVSLQSREIILLGDFKMDLLTPNQSWIGKLENYHLHQIIPTPCRVTATSKTLIDHTYVSNTRNIIETCLPVFGCSDHFPICVTWSKQGGDKSQC